VFLRRLIEKVLDSSSRADAIDQIEALIKLKDDKCNSIVDKYQERLLKA